MFAFCLDVPSIEGTVCEERIKQVTAKNNAERAIYRLKSTSKSLSRNIDMYTQMHIDAMKDQLKDFLVFFGYTDHPSELNDTNFFTYKREDGTSALSEQDLKSFKGYLDFNAKTMKKIKDNHDLK